jgi:hypothetical protein
LPQTKRDLARKFWDEVWNSKDLRHAEEYFVEDLVLHVAGADFRGRDGIGPMLADQWFGPFPDLHVEIAMQLEEGDFLVESLIFAGTHTGTPFHPGDYVWLPADVPHTLRSIGDEGALMLQTHDEPSFLNFIRAVGVPAAEPRPDPASLDYPAMNEIAGETGQPVLGPPMSAEEADEIVTRWSRVA